jgi:proline dehydrogenase
VLTRVARRYIAGDALADATATARTLADRSLLITMGYWNAPSDDAAAVAREYLSGLDALAGIEGSYLSTKLPALGFSPALLAEVLERGARRGVRVHLDSHWPATAARTRALLDEALSARPEAQAGITLPGRWTRTTEDAEWACARGLFVRVVKGEWPDPGDPHRDLRAGYLQVIDALAGAARHVGVATHDPWLAAEAVRRLRDASTPCTLELLYGLPMRESIRQARALDLPVRVYVPYGTAYMPYALSQLRGRPRMALWLARDLWSSTLDRDPLSR